MESPFKIMTCEEDWKVAMGCS